MEDTNQQASVQTPLQKISQLLWRYKIIIIPAVVALVLTALLLFSFLSKDSDIKTINDSGNTTQPTRVQPQQSFKVIQTVPANNAQGVLAGEIQINITTDVPIVDQNSFSLEIQPSLAYPLKFNNTYPTKEIKAYNLGRLQPNTIYRAIVRNKTGDEVYTWTFRTSNQLGQSESALRTQLDKDINKTYYPLLPYLPYNTSRYSVKYADRLTLRISPSNEQADRADILEQVKKWVSSKNVNPDTHTYTFNN